MALLQFLIPPRLYLPIPQISTFSTEVVSMTLPLLETAPIIESAPGITWQGMVFQLWLIGVVIFLVISLLRRIALEQILKTAKPLTRNSETMPAGSIPVRYHAQIPRAFAYGFFQPGIFLPADAGQWSNAEYNFILQHEIAHIRRRDPLLLPVQNIIQCLFFFHPLVWLANHMIIFYHALEVSVKPKGDRNAQIYMVAKNVGAVNADAGRFTRRWRKTAGVGYGAGTGWWVYRINGVG
jgi:beta-lactamase regulating signal transducer with metallopeptidase domain